LLAGDHRHRERLGGGPADCGAWMAPAVYQGIKSPLIVQSAEAEDQGLKLVVVCPVREPVRQFHALGRDLVSRVRPHR
jgi:hypothetical protein